MRILHVISAVAPRNGGPAKVVREMGREMVRRGNQVAIYTTDLDGTGRLDVPLYVPIVEESGLEFRYFPARPRNAYAFSLSFARAVAKAIPTYDVVHIHSIYRFTTAITSYYCRRYKVPYIIRPHGTLLPVIVKHHRFRKMVYDKLVDRRNLEGAATVHFTTESEMETALALGLRIRGVVVPLGIELAANVDDGEGGRLYELWPETRGKLVVLFLGRLYFQKGLDVLVRAFGQVARQRDDVHLLIAGPNEGRFENRIREWLKAEGLLNKATFTGMLRGREKDAAFARSDIFALSSYGENFGIAVVEAMAAGLPVVISNKVGIWKLVSAACAGLVTECDPDDISDALLKLLGDQDLRRRMGLNGRRLVHDHFTWEGSGELLTEMYRNVLKPDAMRANLYP